ncbi:tripartite tricarboxylate transporter substrate binding protein [Pigmentiphaga soli]|uniref:Tripartite tricarboxylate transporter substrate binding protein n=1 Tax=Pigmentiphaga soli TaxID=1007095 RepID=A0ABP8GEV1_9BURK
MKRRTLLQALPAVPLLGRTAWAADSYPNKPIRIIIGYAAGGAGDLVMRIIGPKLAARLGQPVVIENRPGAGGISASQVALSSPADGYTLVLAAGGNFGIAPVLFKSLPYDPVKDFDMVAQAASFAYVFAVNADSRFKKLQDLIDYAKANPGKLNIGTIQVGSGQYFAAELFKSMVGIKALTVPYRTSGDVIAAVRSGDADVMIETIAPLMGQIRSGAMRALATTGPDVFPGLPDVPAITKTLVPGYVVAAWNGLAARAGTPKPVINRLDREIAAILKEEDVQKAFIELGTVAQYGGPEVLRGHMMEDIERWAKVMQDIHMEKQ